MKIKNMLPYILLIIHIVLFFVGLNIIIESKEQAVSLVTDTIYTEDILASEDQIKASIELYSNEYRKRGGFIVVLSAMGIIGVGSSIYNNRK